MKLARIFRILFALVFFIFISAQFFDIYNSLPKWYYKYNPAWFQFTPSLLRALSAFTLAGAWVFLSFLIFTFVFGRAYCSFLCPFGILSDILRRISLAPAKLPFVKNTSLGKFCAARFSKLHFAKARNFVRGFCLGLSAVFLALGWTSLLGFLDPYSLFGKVFGGVFHTLSGYAANLLSSMLYSAGIYAVEPTGGSVAIPLSAFCISLAILLGLFVASALRGRLFCNTLCPVGAILGLIGKVSIFTVKIDSQSCVKCGMCARECKAQCIDFKNKKIDSSRCVDCFDCSAVCRKNAVRFGLNDIYKFPKPQKKTAADAHSSSPESEKSVGASGAKPMSGRRSFGKNLIGLGLILGAAAKNDARAEGLKKRLRKGRDSSEGKNCADGKCAFDESEASPYGVKGHRPEKRLTVPAGAISVENFLEHCTGCQICTAACKAHILKPSTGQWGLAGFMQPYMDYSSGFCLDTCHGCAKVCPTGAINFVTKAAKRNIKIGTAIFDENLCVVKRDGTDCSACGEHCPVQAIEMLPFGDRKKSLYIPHVHKEVCIGCGACEYVCPVTPQKAIVVSGLAVHRKSKTFNDSMRLYKPEQEEDASAQNAKSAQSQKKSDSNPFPF